MISRYLISNLKHRKGVDRLVFIVASMALAIMFVVLYFTTFQGWLDQAVAGFTDQVQ